MIESKFKIGGEYVTAAEFDRHMKAKRKKFGNPTIGEPGYKPPYVSCPGSAVVKEAKCGNQFADAPELGDMIRGMAEKRRPGCTKGSKWMSQLSKFPGDPDAWVKDESDIRRAADIKGVDIGTGDNAGEGLITHHCRREVKPKQPVALNKKIVREEMQRKILADPSLKGDKARLKKAKEDVYNTFTPRWKRHLLKG